MNKERLGYTEEQYKIFKRHSWMVLLAFSILYCFLYCGRQNLSYAMPAMMSEEGWTALQLGVLSSVQFWAYAFGHLINGRLGEIVGVNKLIVIGMVLSAAMNILIGFQTSLFVITIIWAINGYVQSMLWSPGMALVANWWPSSKRGFATGFANAFSGLGSVITAFVVSFSYVILPKSGWRSAFIGSAIIMLVVVVIYPFFAKEKPPFPCCIWQGKEMLCPGGSTRPYAVRSGMQDTNRSKTLSSHRQLPVRQALRIAPTPIFLLFVLIVFKNYWLNSSVVFHVMWGHSPGTV